MKPYKQVIADRCPTCTSGAALPAGNSVLCTHAKHTTVVGGPGTQWAAKCGDFRESHNGRKVVAIHVVGQ